MPQFSFPALNNIIYHCRVMVQNNIRFTGSYIVLDEKVQDQTCNICRENYISAQVTFKQDNGTFGYAHFDTSCKCRDVSGLARLASTLEDARR